MLAVQQGDLGLLQHPASQELLPSLRSGLVCWIFRRDFRALSLAENRREAADQIGVCRIASVFRLTLQNFPSTLAR